MPIKTTSLFLFWVCCFVFFSTGSSVDVPRPICQSITIFSPVTAQSSIKILSTPTMNFMGNLTCVSWRLCTRWGFVCHHKKKQQSVNYLALSATIILKILVKVIIIHVKNNIKSERADGTMLLCGGKRYKCYLPSLKLQEYNNGFTVFYWLHQGNWQVYDMMRLSHIWHSWRQMEKIYNQ